MAPQGPRTADGSRKAQPSLDAQEPDFAAMLEQYCDLRRRGFSKAEIQTKLHLKRHHPSLLLAEAARRGMPGSQDNQSEAVAEWLLSCFDAGIEVSAIRRMSALTPRGIKQRLKRALDTASGNPPSDLITPAPDGKPGRVSWLDPGGRLMHRPFDGAFPAHYTAETALAQCRQVFIELLDHSEGHARDRAYTMLRLARVDCTPSTAKQVRNSTTPCTTPNSITTPSAPSCSSSTTTLMSSNCCCKCTPSSTG